MGEGFPLLFAAPAVALRHPLGKNKSRMGRLSAPSRPIFAAKPQDAW